MLTRLPARAVALPETYLDRILHTGRRRCGHLDRSTRPSSSVQPTSDAGSAAGRNDSIAVISEVGDARLGDLFADLDACCTARTHDAVGHRLSVLTDVDWFGGPRRISRRPVQRSRCRSSERTSGRPRDVVMPGSWAPTGPLIAAALDDAELIDFMLAKQVVSMP